MYKSEVSFVERFFLDIYIHVFGPDMGFWQLTHLRTMPPLNPYAYVSSRARSMNLSSTLITNTHKICFNGETKKIVLLITLTLKAPRKKNASENVVC